MSKPRIAVAGRTGRMAQAVAEALAARTDLESAGSFGRGEPPPAADVIVDFTTSAASAELAGASAEGGAALIIGSTGWAPHEWTAVEDAARRVPIVAAGNFSLGVSVLLALVAQAARALGPEYDIEILEAHHRRKIDAPSGTALMLKGAVVQGRGPSAVGMSVIRAGGIVGEHSVMFVAEDELVTLSHSARDRSLFARGALTAAAWVAGRPPGLYDMEDVLGLRD